MKNYQQLTVSVILFYEATGFLNRHALHHLFKLQMTRVAGKGFPSGGQFL